MLDNFYGFECAETNHGAQNLSVDEVSYLVFKSIICTSSIIQLKANAKWCQCLITFTILLTQYNRLTSHKTQRAYTQFNA